MQYQPDFLSAAQADTLQQWLLNDPQVCWRREQFSAFGRTTTVPRRLSWFGDAGLNYRYTGLDHVACGWPAPLIALREKVNRLYAQEGSPAFNFLLLNRYEDGREYMGWHRDDERDCAPEIASISLGAPRRFRWRCASRGASRFIDLAHGSLLRFDGRNQHMLCKTSKPAGVRVNLTFRRLLCS